MSKLISLFIAVLFSFILFVGMTLLIEPSQVEASPARENPAISITFEPDDDPINPRIRLPKQPEEPEIPPRATTQTKTKVKPDKVAGFDFKPHSFRPTGDLAFGLPTELGGTGDGALTPKVRINPTYPRPAAADGIEGYVTLTFDISAMGTTENIRIIEAKPRGMFERSARKALRKWRYSPKMVDNKPVGVHGETVTLEYRLEKTML